MRKQTDWGLVAGRAVGFALLGLFGIGAAFVLAGFTLFALIFMVGLATVGAIGVLVAAATGRLRTSRRQDRLIVDADYTVIDDRRPRQPS